MTDDPGNSGQNATIRRTQGLRAAGEVRILGRWKYFERYSEKGRVPVVRTQSAFALHKQQTINPMDTQRANKLNAHKFLSKTILALLIVASSLASTIAADLSIAYSQSPGDQALIVSFFNRQTVGSKLVGTLQIQNLSGTWVYIEQDLTSSPSPVAMPYTIYLLGPDATKTFQNFSFPQGSYLKLTATTPVGLDFTHPNEKSTALQGAFAVDLITRGLLTFSLPGDAFDQPPVGEVVEPLLDTIVSTVSPIGEVVNAIKDRSVTEAAQAVLDIAADSKDVEANLAALLKNYVTADQVHSALGWLGELLDLPLKASLLTDLTAMTFQAPPVSWSRMDVVARTQAASIASVSPTTLTTMPVPQTQPLTIHGAGFTSSSCLIFSIGTATYPSRPERLHFIDANTLEYDIAVSSAVGTWTVVLAEGSGSATFQVTASSSSLYTITPLSGPHGSIYPSAPLSKAGGESQTFTATPQDSTYTVDSWYVDGTLIVNAGNTFTLPDVQSAHSVYVTFKPKASSTQTGALTVTLQPQGAISAGAQWQVDGGNYRNSGDTTTGLTPGTHTVSCKTVPGYSAPSAHSVTITAGVTTSDSATYDPITASTYRLILNNGGNMGYIVNAPSGSWNGAAYVYDVGSVVQLTANAMPGFHFVGWGGDLSGTMNPTSITMTGDRAVTANFAVGDPNMGTIIVNILPQAAASAGVKWGWNQNDFRDSGTSYTTWAGAYFIVLHSVDGWISPVPSGLLPVTLTAGQTTTYTATFTQDTTPGLLTVTLSPQDAVTAGARWHVNGGTAQGNGATVSLPPGTNYVLTFDSVSGWTSPLSQTVTVQRAQTVIAGGNYTPRAGQPVIGSISPPLGWMSGGTLLTIGGVNFTAPASVLVGGQPATSVVVSSSALLTCVAPATSTYGTAPVVVQTSGGSTTNLNGFAYGMTLGKKVSLVGSVGGSAFGVAVQGNYAYVGEGRSLLVLDISTPSSPSRVGKVVLPGAVMDIALLGQYAYVAALEGGLQVVKISNPAAPSICGFYSTTNRASAEGIAILGGLAYVADDYAGIQIFDLANPVVPALLSSKSFGDGVAVKVKASGSGVLAYVSTGAGLCVLDVSQPSSPVLLGQTAVGDDGIYGSIALYGNSVIGPTIDGTIHMIDVSQPSAPKDLTLKTGDNGTGGYSQVAVAGNYLYAESSVSGLGFTVFSISGTNLTRVGRNGSVFSPGGYYQKMLISGSRAYVAAGGTGLQIVDISSPSNPLSVAAFADSGLYGNYGAVGMTGNYLCVGAGDFKVFNVSQPSQPLLVGQLSGIGASKVVAGNGVAYTTANNNVIDVITIGAGSPQIVASIPSSAVYATRLALAGNVLCAVGDNTSSQARFVAVDVSNPASPTVRGTKDFTSLGTGLARGVAASGGKAVVAISPNSGQPMLSFLDISNLSTPTERGSLANVNAQDIRISLDGNYAFVNDYVSGRLLVINISSLSSPLLVTSITVDSSWFTGLDIRGNELFVTTARGLYVFDISNPAAPALARNYAVTYIFGGVCAPGDSAGQARNVYLGDSDAGIVALKEDDSQAPNIYITNPTFSPAYTNATSTLNLGGGSDDDVGVTRIAWSNSQGGGGEVSSPFDNWFVSGIRLLPGTNVLTATAFDQAGNSGSDTLTVIYQPANQNQSVTFPSIADHTFGDPPITLVAAASSGLPVTFSVVSGPATLTSSNVLRLTGAGVVTVQAVQRGNASFNAAPSVDVSFNVAKADQAILFAHLPDRSAAEQPFLLGATASSGLPVSFQIVSGPATLGANNVLTMLGGGLVTVSASQAGDPNYNAAPAVVQSFNVVKIPQTISFQPLSRQTVGDAPFELSAAASSGLVVGFSVVSGPAVLSGSILTVTGPGLVIVRATQPGNAMYAAAADLERSFMVVSGINVITGPSIGTDKKFHFSFVGEFGQLYVVQLSSDLKNWIPVATNTVDALGNLDFTDSTTTPSGARFYRVVAP